MSKIQKAVVPKIARSAAVAALAFIGMSASLMGQAPNSHRRITICHRTGSATNPYILITPNVKGVIDGHLDHEQTGNGLGGDIIPEFTYLGVTYSKNLGIDFGNGISGARILANGCKIPKKGSPTPTPTPTRTPPGPSPTPPVPVPEPVTIILFGTGLAAVGAAARRRFGKMNDVVDETESQ